MRIQVTAASVVAARLPQGRYHAMRIADVSRTLAPSSFGLTHKAGWTANEKRNCMFWAGRPKGRVGAPPG